MRNELLSFVVIVMASLQVLAEMTVTESARQIPVAFEVDVVVIGGTSRGVAAAEAAAQKGASVFLAAPRPYLGEDICGTYRLWLEAGEEPATDLQRAMFSHVSGQPTPIKRGYPFTYTASRPFAKVHPDSKRTVLTDGKFSSAAKESVQYGGDVSITADLGEAKEITRASVLAYQRKSEFVVEKVALFTSMDKKSWKKVATVGNKQIIATSIEEYPLDLPLTVGGKARYLRFDVEMADEAERILLAEIVIQGPEKKKKVQTTEKSKRRVTTPWTVKAALDDALLKAKVDFLYGSYVTDILRDGAGQVAGVVIANRSGRQAVRAKVIIDATDRAIAARLAGAAFVDYPKGKQKFSRIVMGGKPTAGAKDLGISYVVGTSRKVAYKVYEHQVEVDMPDATWGSFARADQEARNKTWHTGQAGAAEMLYQVPPDPVISRKSHKGSWSGPDAIDLDALRPAKLKHVYVLGPSADVSRDAAEKLMRPIAGMALGRRVGEAAAADAAKRSAPRQVAVAGRVVDDSVEANIGEMLNGLRSRPSLGAQHVPSPTRSIPVIARYDTVVVGGGTGGAPAGVGAARGGAQTLVIEYLHGLGGVGTLGRISKYYHGNRVGFTSEVDKGVVDMAAGEKVDSRRGWNIENKMEWLRRGIVKAGGDVWYQSLGAGSIVVDKTFVGVVVATPHGRGAVLAHTVIDATGNAVIPACAGLETQEITGEHISVQGTGLPPYTPGESYKNSDWTFTDDDDVLDMWRIHVVGRKKYRGAFDTGQLIDTRARRRIVGDIVVSPMDIINKRIYPDVITVSKSNFDNHGFSSHELFMITPADKAGLVGNVPYRALLPKGYEGILVTGLGMSAHGDAMPVMRMQPDVQNQGYAAGKASAMAAEEGIPARQVDISTLQKHLVDKGIIPESMVGASDSYPISADKMYESVKTIGKNYSGIAQVLANPKMGIPMLQDAYKNASNEDEKLRYAHVLGMLFDDTGAETLIKAVDKATWDKGWNFRGMGQFGATTSPVDNLVIALGRTGRTETLATIIRKLKALTPASEFSHARAVAMALEHLKSPQAAAPLAEFLKKPGTMGHSFLEINDVISRTPSNINDNSTRNNSLRELIVARALYRCGDHEGLGEKILNQYAADFRGHYSRHAKAVLNERR